MEMGTGEVSAIGVSERFNQPLSGAFVTGRTGSMNCETTASTVANCLAFGKVFKG